MSAAVLVLETTPVTGFNAAQDALRFMLAGNARVTLASRPTGARFTYRVSAVKERRGDVLFFVSLLTGPDNEGDYRYLGTIRERQGRLTVEKYFRHGGEKACAGQTAPSALAFAWAFSHLVRGVVPADLEVTHEGRCGRCGRSLTVPESVASGLGPECAGKI